MKCLDHLDMAVMAGAAATVAVFLFAYLGIERGPLTPPEPMTPAAFLPAELLKAVNEAMAAPVQVTEEQARTQAALGKAITKLALVKLHVVEFLPSVAKSAAAGAKARREFLEGVFKLPSDWGGAAFTTMEQAAEAATQPELGRMIVAGSQALAREMGAAEAEYGRAFLAAALAAERAAHEPAASQATILAAARVMTDLAERTVAAPGPVITREPLWGFGSIGDGALIPFMVLGGGAVLLLAGAAGMSAGRLSTWSMTAYCDVHDQDVVVDMLVSDDTPYEVARCSAFDGTRVTCDKRCLKWPMARAA